MTFDEFEDTARELFGFDAGESRDFADTLEAAGLFPAEADADDRTFWEIASELTDEFFEDVELPEEEMYPLDPRFPGDEYMEAGIEWEMTAESIEGYGEE